MLSTYITVVVNKVLFNFNTSNSYDENHNVYIESVLKWMYECKLKVIN